MAHAVRIVGCGLSACLCVCRRPRWLSREWPGRFPATLLAPCRLTPRTGDCQTPLADSSHGKHREPGPRAQLLSRGARPRRFPERLPAHCRTGECHTPLAECSHGNHREPGHRAQLLNRGAGPRRFPGFHTDGRHYRAKCHTPLAECSYGSHRGSRHTAQRFSRRAGPRRFPGGCVTSGGARRRHVGRAAVPPLAAFHGSRGH
jgi:hypothetical protein